MKVIEGCPRTEVSPEVAFLERRPYPLAVRHASHITLAPFGMIPGVRLGTLLQLADDVLHTPAALLVARSRIHRHSRQVVSPHMPVEPVPVGIGLGLGRQPRLLPIGGKQTVAVILEQRSDVQLLRPPERSVKKRHITKGKLIGIEPVLRSRQSDEEHKEGQRKDPFHIRIQFLFHFEAKIMTKKRLNERKVKNLLIFSEREHFRPKVNAREIPNLFEYLTAFSSVTTRSFYL